MKKSGKIPDFFIGERITGQSYQECKPGFVYWRAHWVRCTVSSGECGRHGSCQQFFYIPTVLHTNGFTLSAVLHYQRFYIPTGNQWKRETQIKNGLPALGEAYIIMPEQIPYRFQSRPRNTYFHRDLRIWLQPPQCRLPVPYRLPDQEQSRRC